MDDVYIVGCYSSSFGRYAERSYHDLTQEAVIGAINDADLSKGAPLSQAYFGSCTMHVQGQTMIRGQAAMLPLVDMGWLPQRMPTTNVEGACATGSLALNGALKDILSGYSELSLAVGVEKLFDPVDPGSALREISGGFDNLDRPRWLEEYRKAAEISEADWDPGGDRSIAMDTYGVQAALHMKRYGTTQEQIAIAAAKNHNYGVLNPKAQYRFPMTVDEVMQDRLVSGPLTRSMCAPIGDGAAAAVLCSADYLKTLPAEVRARAVRIRASATSGGMFRKVDEPSLTRIAADKAYEMAGIGPADIDLAEVHDATSFCEIYQMEMMRFCPEGDGGAFVASGMTGPGGRMPVNTSGGLVSKGHPIAATGLSMTYEVVTQLRGEAGKRQVSGARVGLIENGGGVIGLEEAVCVVTILDKLS